MMSSEENRNIEDNLPNNNPPTLEFEEPEQEDPHFGKNNIIAIAIIFILFLGIISGLIIWFTRDKSPIESAPLPSSNNNQLTESEDEIEYEGFADGFSAIEDPANIEPPQEESDKPAIILEKEDLIGETVDLEALELSKPTIEFSGPDLNDKGDYVRFTYKISMNEAATDEYSSVTYIIDADGCDLEGMFNTSTDFSSTINDPSKEEILNIEIYEDFLKSKTDLRSVDYELRAQDKVIKEGTINAARCKEAIDYGAFSIEGPEIDKYTVEGKYHFNYDFEFDKAAKEIIEKGFKYEVDHDCEDWLDGQGYFSSDLEAGIMDNMGFAENITKDAFEDKDDLLEDSEFRIYDNDDELIYEGDVKVPNCD